MANRKRCGLTRDDPKVMPLTPSQKREWWRMIHPCTECMANPATRVHLGSEVCTSCKPHEYDKIVHFDGDIVTSAKYVPLRSQCAHTHR
jgi:hypothetical protein